MCTTVAPRLTGAWNRQLNTKKENSSSASGPHLTHPQRTAQPPDTSLQQSPTLSFSPHTKTHLPRFLMDLPLRVLVLGVQQDRDRASEECGVTWSQPD